MRQNRKMKFCEISMKWTHIHSQTAWRCRLAFRLVPKDTLCKYSIAVIAIETDVHIVFTTFCCWLLLGCTTVKLMPSFIDMKWVASYSIFVDRQVALIKRASLLRFKRAKQANSARYSIAIYFDAIFQRLLIKLAVSTCCSLLNWRFHLIHVVIERRNKSIED